jgi:hypothetical protein
MIVGIKNIYLYTGLTATGGNASAEALQWFDDNNIKYIHMWYGDLSQHQEVFDSLNTWNIGTFADFPFVIYEELHDDYTAVNQALIGLDAIKNSNLVELQALTAS